jgi:pimeloyl-ACP methyl ester carboxylesterase
MSPKKIACAGLIFLLAAACAGVKPESPPAGLSLDWGEPKTFDYQGIKINYYEAGRQGPPVLLLHGFGACAYTWRFLIPALAEGRRVFTLELKGFGLSDKPADGRYAVADQAEIVADFIRQHNLRHLAIMGNSMGGAVALMTYFKLREEAPPRISKLVLIDSAGYPQKLPCYIRLAQIPGLGAAVGKLLSPRLAATLVLRKCYYDNAKITEEQINTYAYYGSLPGAPEAVSRTAAQLVPNHKEMEALIAQYKTITVPVLIVWGREDEVVPLKVGENFKRDIPNSELVVIPQCGHIPLEEEPEATKKAVLEFLKK